MVSTRQMSTTLSSTASSSTSDETMRISVVTRQSSSNCNYVMSAATIPSITTPSISSSAMSSAPLLRSANSNQSNLTQVGKELTTSTTQQSQLGLLDLPTEILYNIFSYVGYKKIGQLRVISHKFNDVGMHVLNSTFSKLTVQTLNRFQAIKANMPRRESARRNHFLATECDIIETCYMRLSLLQMTFGKRIERGHCCFFPGAILDEVYTVLNYIRNTPKLERPYRVTDELFDLSTMAMEYFRDKIEPSLPDIAYYSKSFFAMSAAKRPALINASDLSENASNIPSPPQSNMVLRKGIRKIKQGMKMYNNQLSVLRNELRTWKRKASEQGKQIAEQQKILSEQQKQTLEYANRLDENDKKNEEMSRKFSTLLQELNKCKTELQYWRAKSPATATCTSCGQKTVSTLPLDEYNALINQGVKPEDIILNLDDTEESDASMNNETEFVSPDKSTTAKLLAVNAITKNLKRSHSDENICDGTNLNDIQSQSTSTSVDNILKITSGEATAANLLANCNDKNVLTIIPEEIIYNSLVNNVTTNSALTSYSCNTHSSHPDLNLGLSNISKNSASNSDAISADGIEYPPYKFYGNNPSSTTSEKKISSTPITTSISPTTPAGNYMPDLFVNKIDNAKLLSLKSLIMDDRKTEYVTSTEDVVSLSLLVSNDTKKARRVQKANNRITNGNSKRKHNAN